MPKRSEVYFGTERQAQANTTPQIADKKGFEFYAWADEPEMQVRVVPRSSRPVCKVSELIDDSKETKDA